MQITSIGNMPKKLFRRHHRKINKLKSFFILFFIVWCLFKCIEVYRCRNVEYVPRHLLKFIRFDEKYVCNCSQLEGLTDKLEKLNSKQEVRNRAAFGPVHRDTPVLVVRAGRDAERLQYLIVSLAQVDHIHSAIVVFSHSCYNERLNQLIESITFCMVLQIYYMNSVQLSVRDYSGVDTNNCVNKSGWDSLRRYAHLAELKQHWWWTAHFVFDEVAWVRIHEGMVVFLEEDSYVLPDLLHMLRFAGASQIYLPEVQLVSFGRPLAQGLDYDKLTVDSWRPPYDKGLAFNRTTWQILKTLSDHFCRYDDLSWSYSLLFAISQTPQGRLIMAACMAPRVLSTGVFKNGKEALESIYQISRLKALFPSKVEAVVLNGRSGRVYRRFSAAQGNGGWSDPRNLLFCLEPLWATAATEDESTTPSPVFTFPKVTVTSHLSSNSVL